MGNEIKMWLDTKYTDPDVDAMRLSDFARVYTWQYVSFMRRNGTTLDFIVRNQNDLMSLINVV